MRDGRRHVEVGRLVHLAGQPAPAVTHEVAPHRVGHIVVHAGQGQHVRVGVGEVSGDVADQHRVVGGRFVEVLEGEVPVVVDEAVVEPPGLDRCSRWGGGRSLCQGGHYLSDGRTGWGADLRGGHLNPGGQGMHMGLDEPGEDDRPSQVDHLGVRSGVA